MGESEVQAMVVPGRENGWEGVVILGVGRGRFEEEREDWLWSWDFWKFVY